MFEPNFASVDPPRRGDLAFDYSITVLHFPLRLDAA